MFCCFINLVDCQDSPYSKHLIKLRKKQVWPGCRWHHIHMLLDGTDIFKDIKWSWSMRGWMAQGGLHYVTSLFSLTPPLTLSLTQTFSAPTKAKMHWKHLIYQMFYGKSIFLNDWLHCDPLWSDESEMLYAILWLILDR